MSEYICHFCSKTQDDVSLMIAGPAENSGICDECVQVCVDIVFKRARSKNLIEFPRKAEDGEQVKP